MKSLVVPFALAAILLAASPAFGQQPAPKPEMPPWNGAVFVNAVTSAALAADIRLVATCVLSHALDTWRQ